VVAGSRAAVLTRGLILAAHPGPSLAIAAMISALAARAAPHGLGPAWLVVPAAVAGQFSIGWSNDYADAARDAAADRAGKPVVAGAVSRGAVAVAAGLALAASLGLGLGISLAAGLVNAVMLAAGWAYNFGLKSSPASGLLYLIHFGLIPQFAASTLPGSPAARPVLGVAAALLGLGAHFANVLPDLDGDQAAGVRGLPQLVAARGGPRAVRLAALAVLLAASAVLALAEAGPHRPVALAGLGAAAVLAAAGTVLPGRLPFLAAMVIAVIDVALFVLGGVALT
jgi:4-hydroxybenzoate polyprenyltransferase